MNKKKGFTLIELLAIIVILAIIAVITVPIILNIIDDAEKNSAMDSAHGYKDALQKYYATKSIQNPESELPSGYVDISKLASDFTVNGQIPSEGWVKLKNGLVERYSLKYKDYVVTMDNDKNVVSEKKEQVYPHVTDEYQEVKYLESTGTQYIKTTTNVLETDYIETEFSMPYVANQLDKYMVSTQPWNNPDGSRFSMGVHTNGGLTSLFCSGFGSKTTSNTLLTPNTVNDSEFHKWIYNNKIFKIDDLNLTFDGKNIDYSQNPQNSIYLFYGYNSPTAGKLKKYIQKRNDDPILYLVPVIRKSDNKPGMLDLATRTNNLFNYSTIAVGNRIVWATGIDYADNTAKYSDFIKVTSGQQYKVSDPCIVIGYDSKKNYLGVLSGAYTFVKAQGNFYTSFVIPTESDCVYIKLLVYGDKLLDNNTMLNEGSTALPYEPYGYKFYTNAGTDEFITGPEI